MPSANPNPFTETRFVLRLDNQVLYGPSRQELRHTFFRAVDQLWDEVVRRRRAYLIDSSQECPKLKKNTVNHS
jgi:hypothetical protein